MRINISFTENKNENYEKIHNLVLLKVIKSNSNLSLRESKSFLDEILSNPNNFYQIDVFDPINFEKEILSLKFGKRFTINTFSKRHENLLSIGIADKEDYLDYISHLLINNIISKTNDIEKKSEISNLLKELDKKDLIKLFEKLKK
jgi:hypothetical protein